MEISLSLNGRQKTALFFVLVAAGFNLLGERSLRSTLGIMLLGLAVAWAIGSRNRLVHASLLLSGISLLVGPVLLDWRHQLGQVADYKKQVELFESKVPQLAELYPSPKLVRKDIQAVIQIKQRLEKNGDTRAAKVDILLASFLALAIRKAYPAASARLSDAELLSSMLAKHPEYQDLSPSPELTKSVGALLDGPTTLKPSLKVRDLLLNPLLMEDLTPAEECAALQGFVPGFAELPADAQEKLVVLLGKLPPSLTSEAEASDKEEEGKLLWAAHALAAGVNLDRVPENEKPGDEPPPYLLWRSVGKLAGSVIAGLLVASLGLASLVGAKPRAEVALAEKQDRLKKGEAKSTQLEEAVCKLSEAYVALVTRLPSPASFRALPEGLLPSPVHYIRSVSDDGRVIKLDDDSVWYVDPADWVCTALWSPPNVVVITADGHMVKVENGERALVQKVP